MGRGLIFIAVAWLLYSCAAVSEEQSFTVLKPFKDCSMCPEMMPLPAGRFIMGADDQRDTYGPTIDQAIRHPFAIGVTEVTFDLYEACVAAGACRGDKSDHGWGRGIRPVINVSWQDTVDYAAWLSATTGETYRLPTEIEWEYAARAGTVTRYPWGEVAGEGHANCRRCGTPWSGTGAAPVAQFPANRFGLFDMNGNVSEWVANCWTERHASAAPNASGTEDESACRARVTRGGDWYYVPILSTSAARKPNSASLWSYTIGFRLVRELN